MDKIEKMIEDKITEYDTDDGRNIPDDEDGDEGDSFGISDDGWSKDDLEPLIEWFKDVEHLAYEIRNARRGAYDKEAGDTIDSLLKRLEGIGENLESVVLELKEWIKK